MAFSNAFQGSFRSFGKMASNTHKEANESGGKVRENSESRVVD